MDLGSLKDLAFRYPLLVVGAALMILASIGSVPLMGQEIRITDIWWRLGLFLIGLILTLVEVPQVLKERSRKVEQTPRENVQARILEPSPNRNVGSTIRCRGWAKNLGSNHLWLAVEQGGNVWPKEGEILPDSNGNWDATIFEDGGPHQFSVALYAVNATGHEVIKCWLYIGSQTGRYLELKTLPEALRKDRVDGLTP